MRDAVRRCSGHTLTLNLESTALNFALPFDLNDSAGKVFLLLGFSARTVRLEGMTSRKPNWFERLFGQPAATSGAESTPVQQPDTAAFPDAASPNGEADGSPATPQNDAPQAPSEAPVSQMRDADFYAAMRVRLAPVKKELGVAPKGAFQFDKDSPVRPYADDLIVRLCLDRPGGIRALTERDLDDRGLVEHLYRMGYRNLWQDLIESDLHFREVRSDSGVLPHDGEQDPEMVWSIESSSYYAGSAPLFLEELFARYRPDVDLSSGIIFASPHRHLTLAREVTNGNDLMGSIGLMATMAAEQYSSKPGQISPRLHLLHMGEVTTFTDVVWGDKDRQVEIQVKPTPYLMGRISDGLDGDGGFGFGGPGGPSDPSPGDPGL